MHRRNATALALLLVAAACQPPVGQSAPCTLNSECAAPRICAAGRCRAACQEARDCPYPLDCVLTSSGVGACQVHEDEACRAGASDCAAPLVCVEGRCRQTCEETPECAIGMTCSSTASACERPPVVAGVCDPLSDQGCPETEVCVIDASGVAACVAGAAIRGVGEVDVPCDASADCAPGLVCAEPKTEAGVVGRTDSLCLRTCQLDPPSSCGPSSRCMPVDAFANGLAGPVVPEGVGLCTEACDVVADTGCPSGETCLVLRLGDGLPVYCAARTPTATAFADCGVDADCGGHALCELAPGNAGPRVCRPLCDVENDACPTGSTCTAAGTTEGGVGFGLCVRTGATP